MAVALTRERYLTEYRAPPIPKKMNLDSQYGACFRCCMARLFEVMAERGYQDRLNVAMEDGHPNVWDCGRIGAAAIWSRAGSLIGSKITAIFRDPHRGHLNLLSRRDSGKSRPRVHTPTSQNRVLSGKRTCARDCPNLLARTCTSRKRAIFRKRRSWA